MTVLLESLQLKKKTEITVMIVLKGQTEASRRPPSVPAHTWGSDEELSTQKSAATQGCVHLEKDDP